MTLRRYEVEGAYRRQGGTMSRRIDNDVTLPHDMADRVSKLLGDLADIQVEHARRTRSAIVAAACQATAAEARNLAGAMVKQLYHWTDELHPYGPEHP